MIDRFGFDKKIQALKEMKIDLPKILADSGQRYFKENFSKQQWDRSAWAPRKKETKKSFGKPILVNTGNLKESMNHTIVSSDFDKIVWRVDVAYAKYLNYGTPRMVSRQFMGGSKEFLHRMKARITFQYNKAIKIR